MLFSIMEMFISFFSGKVMLFYGITLIMKEKSNASALTGSLTEIIGLGPEMVIPPSPPSIIRNTDWSILRNKNDWILHNFERHFSNITNRRSFPFNTECLPEYQTPPLTNSPPEQSSQNASRKIINTNKKKDT